MNLQKYDVTCLPRRIVLGRQTETGVMDVHIDCADWLRAWPSMTLRLWVTLPEGAGFWASTSLSGTELVWPITDTDTARVGHGTVEVVGTTGGVRILSDIVEIEIR